MVGVVETLHTQKFRPVDTSRLEILDGSIYFIVIIRIILEGIHLPHKAILEALASIHRRAMGIERAK